MGTAGSEVDCALAAEDTALLQIKTPVTSWSLQNSYQMALNPNAMKGGGEWGAKESHAGSALSQNFWLHNSRKPADLSGLAYPGAGLRSQHPLFWAQRPCTWMCIWISPWA
jgi:hypothetical protein